MPENNSKIFDDVFRTMEERMPKLMIPFINEVFKTNYSSDISIIREGDKHHIVEKLIETDSCMRIEEKLYHTECESNPESNVIAVRMFQYDVIIALDNKKKGQDGVYTVEFPASCVIYLRHTKNMKSTEQVIILFPDGKEVVYSIPIIKSQMYSKEELFEKKLYILLPYYILKYEKKLMKMEENDKKREILLKEYKDINRRLEETLGKEDREIYVELHELIMRVLKYVLNKTKKIMEEMNEIMGGQILESYRDKLIRENNTEIIINMISKGMNDEEIKSIVNCTQDLIEGAKKKLNEMLVK